MYTDEKEQSEASDQSGKMTVKNKLSVGNAKLEELVIKEDGNVTDPQGYTAGGLHCGIKRKKLDLGWIVSDVPAITAAVYTTNLLKAAPLQVTQESLQVDGALYGVLVNSGNANACTGLQGLQDAYEMRRMFAEQLEVEKHHVAVVSTGVIGELMPMEKIASGIKAIKELDRAASSVEQFEQAILTTDTCQKHLAVECFIDGRKVTVGGAAKGSGMIHPNMATMLGFLTTDADIDQASLEAALKEVTNRTFNRITVDGDTSTNDMVLFMANGLAGNQTLTPEHPQWETFVAAVEIVSQQLAKKIARDGEGATKLIEVSVAGAPTEFIAEAAAKSIVGSSLVKTAVFGNDANWGRIVCAVGYTPQLQGIVNPDKLNVWLGDVQVVIDGLPAAYNEAEAKAQFEQEHVYIKVDLQAGNQEATCWGCDLSYDYVKINASYRT